MSNVLITGIAGFIGKACADKFLQAGFNVYGIDILDNSAGKYMVYARDIVKESTLDILNEVKPDIVLHCAGAADVNYSVKFPEKDFERNVTTIHNILFDMKRCGLNGSRVIFLSSAAVYGQPDVLPISEETELNPISPYALHKKMAEDLCFYFNKNHEFDIIIARIFSAYGPGLRKQIFWDMFQKTRTEDKLTLFGTGKETRDFIYRDDLVEALYLLATKKSLEHNIYNIANGCEISIHDVARSFLKDRGMSEEKLCFSQTFREGNPSNWVADISRLIELGYCQSVTIEDGIKNYIDWVKQVE